MPNYQKKYTFISNDNLYQDYCQPWPEKWNGKKIDTFEKKKKVLKNCCDTNFYSKQIKTIDLKEYGFKYKGKIGINSQLENLVVSIFTEISKIKNYEIRSVGGYLFRYKKNNTITKNVRDNDNYKNAQDWYCEKWNKTGDQKEQWWNEHWAEGAAEYDLKNSCVNSSYLSNHSFGSAIDLNPAENGMNASVWDIPPEIVKIFLAHGFYWGGFYNNSKDAMHFEYMLDFILPVPQSYFLPVKLSTDNKLSNDNTTKYYTHTEKDTKGGYFPLGANTTWHGGIHIHTPVSSEVKAIADGEIVAAKLADTEDKANGHYGSHNFILLKHKVSGSLLNAQFSKNEKENRKEVETHTVQSKEKIEDLATEWSTTLTEIRKANPELESHFGQNSSGTISWYRIGDVVKRPQRENTSTSEESATASKFNASDVKVFYSLYMHLNMEVLSNNNLKKFKWLPCLTAELSSSSDETHMVASGEKLEDLAIKWSMSVKKIRDANPELESHFGQNSSGTISWYRIGDIVKKPVETTSIETLDSSFLDSLKSGEIVKVTGVNVKAGDILWTSGMYGSSPTGLLHFEIFSEENLMPSFTPIEDTDEDCTMDSEAIFGMVEQGGNWFNDKSNIDEKEVVNFYSDNENAAALRSYACKFLSEWAMNLDVAIPNMKGKFITFGLKERLLPYIWWPSAAAQGVDLPASAHVWHYNPIRFLEVFG